MMKHVRRVFSTVEGALDRAKLGVKWRFDLWDHLRITTYRGYGTPGRLYLKGRVLDDKGVEVDEHHDSTWKSITNTIRRIETDEIPGALVRLEFDRRTLDVETDDDGFFDVVLDLETRLDGGGPWHTVPLELLKPEAPDGAPVRADAHVIVPWDDSEFAVVSDLDDTVIRTGATRRLRNIRTVLFNTAHTRAPFPGVAAFYRALTLGPDGRGHNPIFYVSSSPWNLYGMFETFMEVRDLPVGPIFLKDFGFTEDKFFKTSHEGHKLDRIRKLMKTYPELPFVLVGDSGQKDAEIYGQVAKAHADRIAAIYIRDVTLDARDREVDAVAEELAAFGVPMVRAEHTFEAAAHAAEEGLVPAGSIEDVREAMKEEEAGDERT